MSTNTFHYETAPPPEDLAPFVESCWLLTNPAGHDLPVVILPDGRIDLFFSRINMGPYEAVVLGIDDQAEQTVLEAGRTTFAISFKPPAAEYLFAREISSLRRGGLRLDMGVLGITKDDLPDFNTFCARAFDELRKRLPATMDERKRLLFEAIYASEGSVKVQDLAQRAFWSARQINRYFNQTFGLSLKSYLDILRFRAAFPQLKKGRLFPEADFADQPHFIRTIRKFAGVAPKELAKNPDGKFIQVEVSGDRE